MCVQKLANSQFNLPHGTKPNEERVMKKLKTKIRDDQNKRSVIKSVESVLAPEGSL